MKSKLRFPAINRPRFFCLPVCYGNVYKTLTRLLFYMDVKQISYDEARTQVQSFGKQRTEKNIWT